MYFKLNEAYARKITVLSGILLAVFSLFMFVGFLSFAISWKDDQSLLYAQDFFADMVQVSNKAGGLGFKLSNFLVGRCFGFGAFVFCAALAVVSCRLMFLKKIDWLKTALTVLGGSLLASLFCGYVASLYGDPLTTFLGGGIGGNAGAYIVEWMNATIGKIVTPVSCLLFWQ